MTAPILDPAIRAALVAHLRATDPSAVVLHEVPLRWHSVRADIVSVSDDLRGFEIKSDADSFARLQQQIKGYDSVFDFSTIVVGAHRVAKARAALPTTWGILVAEPSAAGVILILERLATRNTSLDPVALVRQLWRPDLVALRRSVGLATDRRALVGDLWEHACELPIDVLRKAVRESAAAHKEVFDVGRDRRRELQRSQRQREKERRAAREKWLAEIAARPGAAS